MVVKGAPAGDIVTGMLSVPLLRAAVGAYITVMVQDADGASVEHALFALK